MYVTTAPVKPVDSFFSIDSANVDIVAVKPLSDAVVRGEVSSAPLDPPLKKAFVIRLQEFAGRAGTVKINLPVKIKSAALLSQTEDKVLQNISLISPLNVTVKPYQTLTIKIEIE
jgi:alpha-mannosidase